MLNKEDNDLLTRVEGDAPMGVLMRQYWTPVLMSEDVISDGAPRRIKILGGKYVAFRDTEGKVGVLNEACPHRGASLALARNENCALQCLYHGWRVDRTGKVVETPSEPADSTFKDKIRHIGYPVREAGGLIWAYFGDPKAEPEFPAFEWTARKPEQIYTIRVAQRCNWAQAIEGAIDAAHANFLHNDLMRRLAGGGDYTGGGGLQNLTLVDGAPKLEIQNLPYGFQYAAVRNAVSEGRPMQYVRTTQFVAPNWALFSAPEGWAFNQVFVPVDDENTIFYFIHARLDDENISPDYRAKILEWSGVGELDENFHMDFHSGNMWRQDRDLMDRKKHGDKFSFSGMTGNQTEDLGVQESMGPIEDRTREHLGTSDLAVIRMRRLMLDAARRNKRGETPIALGGGFLYGEIRPGEDLIEPGVRWQETVGSRGEAPAATRTV
ncbi:Rieske 2Fe-2S domain-containing protein [Rhodococcus sp. USK10]|uniref:Rieske 2Fe-2S domain-containing protein n=1 Tax=Rhodococcus sp. USK10 TaxID=2789739 RepID=UPI001C5D4D30|nr:Rieske 2Fe-2S domain-containing protein [Rhodococcus sp. USK10]QYB07018.1 Rieske 2Fe-2S domain-containing protein [Rhodococcus sp. USK10]